MRLAVIASLFACASLALAGRWHVKSNGTALELANGLSFYSASTGVLASSTEEGLEFAIELTNNGGVSWEAVSYSYVLQLTDTAVTKTMGLVCGGAGVAYSTNMGKNWTVRGDFSCYHRPFLLLWRRTSRCGPAVVLFPCPAFRLACRQPVLRAFSRCAGVLGHQLWRLQLRYAQCLCVGGVTARCTARFCCNRELGPCPSAGRGLCRGFSARTCATFQIFLDAHA